MGHRSARAGYNRGAGCARRAVASRAWRAGVTPAGPCAAGLSS